MTTTTAELWSEWRALRPLHLLDVSVPTCRARAETQPVHWRRRLFVAACVLLAANTLDLILTRKALALGAAQGRHTYEWNPLLAPIVGTGYGWLVKLAVPLIAVLFALRARLSRGNGDGIRAVTVMAFAFCAIVAWNALLIGRLA